MYAIVTTPRFVLGCDIETHAVEVLATGGLFYGFTWDAAGRRIAFTERGYDGPISELSDCAMADRGFLVVDGTPGSPCLTEPHQALWIGDYIAVANTGRNAIARYRADDLSCFMQRFDEVLWDRYDKSGRQGSHFNSVFFHEGCLYVVAHNHSQPSFVLKLEWPSLRRLERIDVPNARGIHNFWIDDEGRWVVCDSSGSALIDARTGESLWSAPAASFLRGLAAADDKVIVGASEPSTRDLRQFTESGLWVVDRATFELRDYVSLGHFGVVHEVRVADRPDACHGSRILAPEAIGRLRASREARSQAALAAAKSGTIDAARWRAVVGAFRADAGILTPREGVFSLAVHRGTEAFRDGRVSARLHLLGSEVGHHAAIVARHGGPQDANLYAAIVQREPAGGVNVSIWVESSGWTCLASTSIARGSLSEAVMEQGLPLALDLRGDLIGVDVDGIRTLEVRNAAVQRGAVGIRAVGDSFGFGSFEWTPY